MKSGFIGVTAKASLLGSDVDLTLARSVVKNIVTSREGITLDSIKRRVCKYYNVTLTDLISRSRRQAIVRPRQVAMYLSRQYTDHSLQTIGKSFNRYHATTMHALKAVEKGVRENGSCGGFGWYCPWQCSLGLLSGGLWIAMQGCLRR